MNMTTHVLKIRSSQLVVLHLQPHAAELIAAPYPTTKRNERGSSRGLCKLSRTFKQRVLSLCYFKVLKRRKSCPTYFMKLMGPPPLQETRRVHGHTWSSVSSGHRREGPEQVLGAEPTTVESAMIRRHSTLTGFEGDSASVYQCDSQRRKLEQDHLNSFKKKSI